MTRIIDKIGPYDIKKVVQLDLKQYKVINQSYGVFLRDGNEFLHEFNTLEQARKACKDRLQKKGE